MVVVVVVVEIVVLANVQSKEYNSNKRKIKQHIPNWVIIITVAMIAAMTAIMDAQHSK